MLKIIQLNLLWTRSSPFLFLLCKYNALIINNTLVALLAIFFYFSKVLSFEILKITVVFPLPHEFWKMLVALEG